MGPEGYEEYKSRIEGDHTYMCINFIFERLIQKDFGSESNQFESTGQHSEYEPDQFEVHNELEVNREGIPNEVNGEHFLKGKGYGKGGGKGQGGGVGLRRGDVNYKETALQNFLLFDPDDDSVEMLWVIQLKSFNMAPDDPATWVVNNGKQWHFVGRWWAVHEFKDDLTKPVLPYYVPKSLADLVYEGKQPEDCWGRTWKGGKKSLVQHFSWNEWGPKCLLGNVEVTKSKVIKAKFVKALFGGFPDLKLAWEMRVARIAEEDEEDGGGADDDAQGQVVWIYIQGLNCVNSINNMDYATNLKYRLFNYITNMSVF